MEIKPGYYYDSNFNEVIQIRKFNDEYAYEDTFGIGGYIKGTKLIDLIQSKQLIGPSRLFGVLYGIY